LKGVKYEGRSEEDRRDGEREREREREVSGGFCFLS